MCLVVGGVWGVGRRRAVVASEPGESGFIGVLTFCLQQPLLCPSQELKVEQICEHKSAPQPVPWTASSLIYLRFWF